MSSDMPAGRLFFRHSTPFCTPPPLCFYSQLLVAQQWVEWGALLSEERDAPFIAHESAFILRPCIRDRCFVYVHICCCVRQCQADRDATAFERAILRCPHLYSPSLATSASCYRNSSSCERITWLAARSPRRLDLSTRTPPPAPIVDPPQTPQQAGTTCEHDRSPTTPPHAHRRPRLPRVPMNTSVRGRRVRRA